MGRPANQGHAMASLGERGSEEAAYGASADDRDTMQGSVHPNHSGAGRTLERTRASPSAPRSPPSLSDWLPSISSAAERQLPSRRVSPTRIEAPETSRSRQPAPCKLVIDRIEP